MKIKSQFRLLLAGIIIIPLTLILIMFSQNYANNQKRLIIPGYDELVGSSNHDFQIDAKAWKIVQKKLSRRPEGIEYLILDKNNKLLLTNFSDFASSLHSKNNQYSSEDIFNFIHTTGKDYFYQIDTAHVGNKDALTVISRLTRKSPRYPNRPINPVFIFVIILFILFLFSSIVIFLITKSITKSVTLLDDCTKRIASGELDVEVEATGSNEIVSLTHSLNKMRLSLQEENIRRSRFIMGISHDLRTPIALIKGYAEAISDGMVDDVAMRDKSVEIIINKADQLNERIDELIDFVKLDTTEWRQSLQSKELKSILDEFCKRVSMDAQLLNKNFSYDIQLPDGFLVSLDEKLFLRALENLTNNAFRYTAKDGNILLSAKFDEKQKSTFISIKDDGQGISQKDLPYIFDPLYRGTNSRREDGKGLGLSIVKTIVNSHGWNLQVFSQEGNGSEFILQLGV